MFFSFNKKIQLLTLQYAQKIHICVTVVSATLRNIMIHVFHQGLLFLK